MALEYRIRWRRADRATQTAIYQGWAAAYKKFSAVQAVEKLKDDLYPGMPDLVEGPVVEFRQVGKWETAPYQPGPVQDCQVETVRDRLKWRGNVATAPVVESGEIPF
jgi:hypothetical protein